MVDEEDKGISSSSKPTTPPATDVEISRHEDESKSKKSIELKDMIGWSIGLLTLLVGLLTIVVAILIAQGFFSKSTEGNRDNSITAELVTNNPEKAKEAAENLLKNPKRTDIDRLIVKAVFFQQQSKKSEAIKIWKRIAKSTEGKENNLAARAWFSVGYLYVKQGKSKEAIEAFSRSIGLIGDRPEIYINRGAAKNDLGQHKGAIADLNKAIELNPNEAGAYINRGIAKHNLSEYEAAIADYNKAISLNPKLAEIYYNRGNTNSKLKQFEAAFADYNEAIRLNPNLTESYINRGITKVALHQFEAAVEEFVKLLGQNPNDLKINYSLGLTYTAMGDLILARRYLKKTVSLARAAGNKYYAVQAEEMLQQFPKK